MKPTARLQGVTRTFKDVVAMRDIDLELQPGRIYGLLGPNGSGKTTTLRTMLGLVDPDRGVVELLGRPPDDLSRAKVGFVPEQRALPGTSKVEALLVFYARMRGFSRADARALAKEWIDRLDLGSKARDRIKTLSNGQQQKVQIALSLMCEPEVILMDEPLAALDPQHQDLIAKHVREAVERGGTVVLSTHRLREAQVLIDHVVMMYLGDKVMDQPLADALEQHFDGTWRIRVNGDRSWVEGPEVLGVDLVGRDLHVRLQPWATIGPLMARAAAAGADVRAVEAVLPTLHELYLKQARAHDPSAVIPDDALSDGVEG